MPARARRALLLTQFWARDVESIRCKICLPNLHGVRLAKPYAGAERFASRKGFSGTPKKERAVGRHGCY